MYESGGLIDICETDRWIDEVAQRFAILMHSPATSGPWVAVPVAVPAAVPATVPAASASALQQAQLLLSESGGISGQVCNPKHDGSVSPESGMGA